MKSSEPTLEQLDESRSYSTEELCTLCQVDECTVVMLLEHGIVEQQDDRGWSWQSVQRIGRAIRVQRDFEIDFDAVPLVLNLFETLEHQRRELRILREAIRG